MIGTRSAGVVLALGLTALANPAHAGDTFRLDMPAPGRAPAVAPRAETRETARASDAATTRTLEARPDDLEADLQDVAYRGVRGGFYGGGYRGGYSGYRGGHYHGGYGGYRGGYYRGGYGGYYRGGYGGYYRGGYGYGGIYRGGYGYGGYYRGGLGYYGGGYGGYYGYSSYAPVIYGGYGYGYDNCYPSYYYSSTWINPCSLPSTVPSMSSALTLQINPGTVIGERVIESYSTTQPSTDLPPAGSVPPGSGVAPSASVEPGSTLPAPQAEEGTYPYDGGPRQPVPMPRIEETPTPPVSSMTIRPADRLVSLPALTPAAKPAARNGKWSFPAYGEEPSRTGQR